MKRFRVQVKSISTDAWGPLLETDDLDWAICEAYYWFDQGGGYLRILDAEDNVIFVDYHWVDDWELMY